MRILVRRRGIRCAGVTVFACFSAFVLAGRAGAAAGDRTKAAALGTCRERLGPTAFLLLALTVCFEADWQKDRFKRDPRAKIWGGPAGAIGGKLLVCEKQKSDVPSAGKGR